jgi:hypothetical protein
MMGAQFSECIKKPLTVQLKKVRFTVFEW